MIDVGRNNHAAASHFISDEFGRELFTICDVDHFFGDQTLTGIAHLREIAVLVLRLAASHPFGSRPGDAVPITLVVALNSIAVARTTIRGSHVCDHLWWILQRELYAAQGDNLRQASSPRWWRDSGLTQDCFRGIVC